jgi:hypothetical protein
MGNDQTQAERLRVLKMLEEGKINAEECAELLDALSVKAPGPTARQRSWARLMILTGAALVLAGFLLPWFGGGPSQAQAAPAEPGLGAAELLILKLARVVPYEEIMPQLMGQAEKLELNKIEVSQYRLSFPGSMVKHGLGWGILGLSLAAGFISLALHGNRGASQRNAALSLLALGAFMIFYLVFLASWFAEFGLAVVLVGYGIETAGVLARHRKAT